MNIALKNKVSAISGTFTVTSDLTVTDLVTDAEGAEIQEYEQGFMIVAGNAVNVVDDRTSTKFFKLLQPSGLTEEQTANGVSFYREDGTKMGVYNYSSNGTVTILLPKKIMIGEEEVSQSIYYYEASSSGYKTAKGSCTVDYVWEEDENFKAEKIENSTTQGYQVWLEPMSSTSAPLKFSVNSGDKISNISIESEDNTIIEKDENDLFQIPIPQEDSKEYIYTVYCEGYVEFKGSFSIDSTGKITDTTTEDQKDSAIKYVFSNGTFKIELQEKIDITESGLNVEADITSQLFFQTSWYPGETKNGKVTISNRTNEDLYIVDYEINLKDEDGNYMIENRLMRVANEPIRQLYGWPKDIKGYDNVSTLADIVYVDKKIKQVYENSEKYKSIVSIAYEESDYFTYPAYLFYYFKEIDTTGKYKDIKSLYDLDDDAIQTIMLHFDGISDQWYSGEYFGDINVDDESDAVYRHNSSGKYGAIEVYDEIDNLLKEYILKKGILLSLDSDKLNVKESPSLYDWSMHTEKAQTHFENTLKGKILPSDSNIVLNNLSIHLYGEAFTNITQPLEWNYEVKLILSENNEIPIKESITLKPLDEIIYMGGTDGYDGVVNENNQIVTSNSLPIPAFKVILPDNLKHISIIDDLILQYKQDENTILRWKFEPYGETLNSSTQTNESVYRIVPTDGTEQREIRINFINSKGEVITSDKFDVGKNLNQTLYMEIYGDAIESGNVEFIYQNNKYDIKVDEATITVLGTTDTVDYGNMITSEDDTVYKEPAITAEEDIYFTINNSNIKVDEDTSDIALIFDNIINLDNTNEKNTQLLKERVDRELNQTTNTRYYDLKYLDIVDKNNGNMWLKTEDSTGQQKDITIYWPLPEGTNKNTNFTLLHFIDLYRDMTTDEIEEDIINCPIEKMEIKSVTDTHVIFEAGSTGFSPFALVWEESNSGGGDGGGGGTDITKYYTLHYESNGGTKYEDEEYSENTLVQLNKVPFRDGYTFEGWYADEELKQKITEIKMTSDKTVYANWIKNIVPTLPNIPEQLNGYDHFSYIVGYPDGNAKPNDNITRAEVAAIFFRLLKPEVRDNNLKDSSVFTDVEKDDWYNISISTIAELGIVKGRTETTFVPNEPITRAEFAAICSRFDKNITEIDSNLIDISEHWAKSEIERAYSLGWVTGYPDNTFRPNQYITRAEAMSIVNRVLCRMPEDTSDLLEDMIIWPDNLDTQAWYYLTVQEATNTHIYKYKNETYEKWLQLLQNPDWNKYMK